MSRASEYANAVSQLYAQQAQNTAHAGAANAQLWGGTIAKLGDFAGNAMADYSTQRTAKKQDDALRQLFSSGTMPAPGQIIGIVGPERGLKIAEAIAALKQPAATNDPDKTLKRLQTVANGLHALPEDLRAQAYPEIVKTFEQQGILQPGQLKPDYDPQYWQFLMGSGQEPKTATPKEPAVDWVETIVDGKKIKRAVERVPGAEFEVPPLELTPDQQADNERQAAAAGLSREQFAEQQRHNRATEAQAARGSGSAPANDTALVAAVMANPDLFYNLTPTVRTRIGPALAEKGFKQFGPAPSAMERMDSRKFEKAGPVLAAMTELSEKINTQQGVIAKISGGVERAKATANLNDDVAEYQALISGFTPLVARALGHTGVLTQQDVDSVKALFPSPGDSKSLRDRKVSRLLNIVGQLEGQQGTGAPNGPAPAAKPSGGGAPSYQDYLKSRGQK